MCVGCGLVQREGEEGCREQKSRIKKKKDAERDKLQKKEVIVIDDDEEDEVKSTDMEQD